MLQKQNQSEKFKKKRVPPKKRKGLGAKKSKQQSLDGANRETFKIRAKKLKVSQYIIVKFKKNLIFKRGNNGRRLLALMFPWDKVVAYSSYVTLLYVYEGNHIVSAKDEGPEDKF